jgi:L-alanine-DL-glutamate epimerase-like enolase superfamily enzyme
MKITDVAVECYQAPLDPPISNGKYTYATHDRCVVRVRTDEGVTGIGLGDGGTGLHAAKEMIRATVESLRPGLLGEDPLNHERIWANMWVPKLIGRRGFSTRVISSIDIALWDLKGKICGVPVAKLLGAHSQKLPAYVAGGYYQPGKGTAELATEMDGYIGLGARAVKMKIGGATIREDIERVRAVRTTIGDDVKLLVDANNAYRPYEAIEFAHKSEDLNVFWLEEPVMPDDYRGLAHVAASTRIPVASGENEYTRYGFRDLVMHGHAAILNPDAMFVGGVTEWMKVAAFAQAYDIPVAPHGTQEVHVHLASAVPNGLFVEYYGHLSDPLSERTFLEPLPLVDGFVSPPDRVGFGIELDEESLAPYRVL